MGNERSHNLWLFIVGFWDDHITMGGPECVYINARTTRVLRSMCGAAIFDELCRRWQRDGDLRVLGVPDELSADAPCIEVLDYVNEYEQPQSAENGSG